MCCPTSGTRLVVGGTKVQKEKHSEGTEPHFAEDIYIIYYFYFFSKRFCDLKMSITSVKVAGVGFQMTTCCKMLWVTNSAWQFWFYFLDFWVLIFVFPGTCRGARSTTSWMVPRELPSDDIERLSASMAAWLERPSSDSPFTAISWSLTLSRPSWWVRKKKTFGKLAVGLRPSLSTRLLAKNSYPQCQWGTHRNGLFFFHLLY